MRISYTEHITNDKVRRRIKYQIGPFVDLLTAVTRKKLRWYGHVTRSNGLSKTVLQGTVEGRRRGGNGNSDRQHRRMDGFDICQVTNNCKRP